jgi:hypothetical protein
MSVCVSCGDLLHHVWSVHGHHAAHQPNHAHRRQRSQSAAFPHGNQHSTWLALSVTDVWCGAGECGEVGGRRSARARTAKAGQRGVPPLFFALVPVCLVGLRCSPALCDSALAVAVAVAVAVACSNVTCVRWRVRRIWAKVWACLCRSHRRPTRTWRSLRCTPSSSAKPQGRAGQDRGE